MIFIVLAIFWALLIGTMVYFVKYCKKQRETSNRLLSISTEVGDDLSSKSRVVSEWNDIIAECTPYDGAGFDWSPRQSVVREVEYDLVDRDPSDSRRGSSVIDEIFTDDVFQVFENKYYHVDDESTQAAMHSEHAKAETDSNRSATLLQGDNQTADEGEQPASFQGRDPMETVHDQSNPHASDENMPPDVGPTGPENAEVSKDASTAKKKVKKPAHAEYNLGEGLPVKERKVKKKKRRKSKKPAISDYSFGKGNPEDKTANESSAKDKPKKPAVGEYSFVTSIDDVESDGDGDHTEKFTFI